MANSQGITKAARDNQRSTLALSLKKRIGRDHCPHLDLGDNVAWDRVLCNSGKPPDTLHHRVSVVPRTLRQQFMNDQISLRTLRDDVGEVPQRSIQNCPPFCVVPCIVNAPKVPPGLTSVSQSDAKSPLNKHSNTSALGEST
jgi:hypothetical protein